MTASGRSERNRPAVLRLVPPYLILLAALLAGYMFLGRGFAHLGRPPFFVGEIVLFLGVLTTGLVYLRLRPAVITSPAVWLVVGFMILGSLRTVPYLAVYGLDALRDAVLWGYAIFALIIYVLADRRIVLGAMRAFGLVIPVFALWLPIAFTVFTILSAGIQPDELGSNVPIVFFKSGDMAVHIIGSLAFLVLGTATTLNVRTVAWRSAIVAPLLWTAFVAGATNRGGLVTVGVGLAVIAAFAVVLRRSWNWVPVLVAPAVLTVLIGGAGIVGQVGQALSTAPTPPDRVAAPSASASPADHPHAMASTACDAAPASRSLVANPGFELGGLDDGTIEGWDTWAGLYNIVEGGAFRGANYASIQNTGEPYHANITSTKFPFQAGRNISVSLWAKALDGSPVIATYVHWLDSSGTEISMPFMTALSTEGQTTWQESTGVLTAPPGTTHASVQLFEAAGDATIGLDEVIVKLAPIACDAAPASRSLVANPGFELGGLDDGTIEGWDTWAGLYNIVEGEAFRGANYASIQNTGEPYHANITSTKFPFQAGRNISVSLWAKALDGSPVIATYVHWWDSSGTEISMPFMTALSTEGQTTWQESTGVLTAPPGTTHASVQLFEAAGDTTIGLDEVIVKSVAAAPAADRRPVTIEQIVENVTSIFSVSSDQALEGTKQYRLLWWSTIVEYTVFGDYFWTGKGFGVNLADADGFQVSADGSLRAPHNSHMTVLARMGVPGLVAWVVLQGAFAIGLIGAVISRRRAGDWPLAAAGAWLFAYWAAMMVNTSFDPYLEGPQGGIWFWSVFGLGMVVMRLAHERREA